MTRPALPVTDRSPEPSRPRQLTRAIGRAAVLIAALTAAGRVIDRTPPLRWLDMLGRRPAAASAAHGAGGAVPAAGGTDGPGEVNVPGGADGMSEAPAAPARPAAPAPAAAPPQ